MDLLAEIEAANLSAEDLEQFVARLDPEQFAILREQAYEAAGVAGAYAYDPARFVREGLKEHLWTKQIEVIDSVRDNLRTAVKASFSVGKSHLAARVVCWWLESWPVGTALALTTATTNRAVKGQLWGHIRRIHKKHALSGRTNLTEWWVGQEQIGIGFSPSDQDPEAVQGWHAPHVLVVIDEAGGISDTLGRALEGLLSSGHARMLAIGNPSMDEADTWFERVCSSPRWNTITIDAFSSPQFTGEDTGRCYTCPRGAPPHSVASHLVSRRWVEDTVAEYGEDDPYVQSRVYARFPEIVANVTIPRGWVDEASKPDAEVDAGTIVALGVDVAADGGDELAIGRREGFTLRLVHHSSGKHLANSVDVAGIVLDHMRAAEEEAKRLGSEERVRVKIDSIGVGLGVASVLEKWGPDGEQLHDCEVVRVDVGQRPNDPEHYANQRAEMWWAGRKAVEPDKTLGGRSEFRIDTDVDTRTKRQLSDPTYGRTAAGKVQIESKKDLRSRGRGSPDRAEALLLALYEPPRTRTKMEIIV